MTASEKSAKTRTIGIFFAKSKCVKPQRVKRAANGLLVMMRDISYGLLRARI
jgi:hypothetical protein